MPQMSLEGVCEDWAAEALQQLRAPMAACATGSAGPHQDRNSERDRPNRAHQDHPLEILKALESCSGSRWSSAKRWTYRDSQTPRRRTGMPGVGSGFQKAMLHTTIFGLEENELPAHNGSIREGRNCFCQVYAIMDFVSVDKHRAAVDSGAEQLKSQVVSRITGRPLFGARWLRFDRQSIPTPVTAGRLRAREIS